MPSLVLFGRRWGIGSDDLVFPSAFDILFRGFWLFASGIVFIKSYQDFNCETTRYGFIGLLGILTVCILLDSLLIHNSKNGSIMETIERRHVPTFLYMRIIVEVVLISWNTLACYWYWINNHICTEKEESLKFIFSFIIFNCVLLGFQFLFCIYAFDFYGASKTQFRPLEENNAEATAYLQMSLPKTKYSRLCLKRLNICCCTCLSIQDREKKQEVKAGFREIARMLALQFGGDDLVHSDVMAGLILLAAKHRREKYLRRRSTGQEFTTELYIINQPKSTNDEVWSADWRSFKRLSHFLKYACAILGWPIVFVQKENPIREIATHWNTANCLPWKNNPVNVEGDNCCFLNTAGLKATIGAECEEIVYVTFKNRLYETPFFVALDHTIKSIVVGIRGSMSLNDFATDFIGWPMPIQGYPSSFKAHHGMLNAATKVLERLESLKILPRLFSLHPDYQLVLTGHSLGAGCATILSFFLKHDYPNLKCYAYAPPGGLLTKPAADYCDEFVISLAYGDDVVTRLGIHQMERLKYNLINVLNESRIPKYQLLMDGFLCCKSRRETYKEFGYFHSDMIGNNSKSTIIDVGNMKTDDTSISHEKAMELVSSQACLNTKFPKVDGMYPPGKIILIRRAAKQKLNRAFQMDRLEYAWRWADRTEFDDIIVSRRMFLDHVPFIMPKSLQYFEKLY